MWKPEHRAAANETDQEGQNAFARSIIGPNAIALNPIGATPDAAIATADGSG